MTVHTLLVESLLTCVSLPSMLLYPKDTAEGTYYVQICSRNANKDLIPIAVRC